MHDLKAGDDDDAPKVDTIPRGVVHRTRAPMRTVILMVEEAGVQPTGDDAETAS